MTYQNRIVRYGLEPIDSVLFHPSNWRIHPTRQQDAMKGALSQVGWVETVLINLRSGEEWGPNDQGVSTLIDGHMRVKLAAQAGETHVPVIYVDLNPEEEAFILATLDPLGALSVTDNEKLLELTAGLNSQHETIKAALRGAGIDMRETFAHISGDISGGEEREGDHHVSRSETPRDPQVYTNSGHAPSGESRPESREKYPLAIVLDRRDYDRWTAWKTQIDERSDTAALKSLLDKAIDWQEE